MKPQRLLGFALLASGLVAAAASAGLERWTPSGLGGGSVQAFAIHPATPRILLAGTSVGLFRSGNRGSTWAQVASIPKRPLWLLAFAPSQPSTVFAVSSNELFRSTDSGLSWILWSAAPPADNRCLTVDPTSPDTLYTCSTAGLQKSTDGGLTWSLANGNIAALGVDPRKVVVVRVDPGDPRRLFVLADERLFRSTDGGLSWAPATQGLPTHGGVGSVCFDGPSSQRLYVSAGWQQEIFKSTNGGNSWSATAPLPQSSGFTRAVCAPSGGRVFAFLWDRFFVSSDAGQSWAGGSTRTPDSFSLDLVVDPLIPSISYVTSELVGVYKTTDSGATFAEANRGLSATQVAALAFDPTTPGRVYTAGLGTWGDGVVMGSSDGGSSWDVRSQNFLGIGDLAVVFPQTLIHDPTLPRTLYIGEVTGVAKTSDGGLTWRLQQELPCAFSYRLRTLAAVPTTPTTLFAFMSQTGFCQPFCPVHRSTDGGETWQCFPGLASMLSLAWSSDLSVLYAGTAGVSKSVDGGETWVGHAGDPIPGGVALAIVVDPRNAERVWIGNQAGLFRSEDGGDSWSPLTETIGSDFTGSLALDPTDPPKLYALQRSRGVAVSEDLGETWARLDSGLESPIPDPSSYPLAIDPHHPGILWTGYTGGGPYLYTRRTPTLCASNELTLCLNGGRFQVRARWKTLAGRTGSGQAVPLTDDTGSFWFFNSDNLELMVKALDGTGVNGNFWFFYGALSNVEYTLDVTDTSTGEVRTYFNPSRTLASRGDTAAFTAGSTLESAPHGGNGPQPLGFTPRGTCAPGLTTLCLRDGRFKVEVDWVDFSGIPGHGHPTALTPDTGTFWFFNEQNLELMVKILDGRPVNGHIWVFYGALSNVGYTVTVTDTETGASKRYENASGQFRSRADTTAF